MRYEFMIEVTQSDLDSSMRQHARQDMVCTAIERTLSGANHIAVDLQTIRFTQGRERLVYRTPAEIRDYIVAFDIGDGVEPFSFTLRNPINKEAS